VCKSRANKLREGRIREGEGKRHQLLGFGLPEQTKKVKNSFWICRRTEIIEKNCCYPNWRPRGSKYRESQLTRRETSTSTSLKPVPRKGRLNCP